MKKLFILAILALSINAFAQIPSYVPSNGLVSWYPFSGNANDASTNAYNGIVYGATLVTDRFGIANSAYSFNGSSNYIKAGAASVPLGTNPRTFSLWLQSTVISSPANRDAFNWGNVLPTNGERFGFTLYSGLPYFVGQGNDFYGKGFIADNDWHNIVITYDGVTVQMYLDGMIDTSQAKTLNTVGDTVVIGRSPMDDGPGATYFSGNLDDIGIWNRVLDSTEIGNLYHGGLCYQTITVTDTLIINANLTGFNPITWAHTIKVYPNPTKDHITIDYGNYTSLAGYTLKIVNTLSQTVFTTSITTQTSYVNLSTWTGNGVYFVNLIDGSGNLVDVRKIVIQ